MLVIRDAQMKAMARPAREHFAGEVRAHLQKYFPDECSLMGAGALDELIAHGIGRALARGFETERQVYKWLSLAIEFGRDFDSDPSLPWVAEILSETTPMSPNGKLDLLVREALERAGRAPASRRRGRAGASRG